MPTPNDVPILIRRTHEERVLAALRTAGPLTRSQLGARVRLSRTTVSEIVGELVRTGSVVEATDGGGHRRRGRPAALLALEPSSGQLLGVDLGHRRVYVAVVNASNEVIGSGAREYTAETPWGKRVDTALELIEAVAQQGDTLSYAALAAIGIGVPGPVSSPLTDSDRVPARWQGMSRAEVIALVQERFESRFAAPVVLDNNTRFAALAEAEWGAGSAGNSLLYVRLSDGVGGGVVVGGRLVSGATGTAGEIGHIEVEPGGAQCWCGKRGCLETVAAVPAVLARARRAAPDITTLSAALEQIDTSAVVDAVEAAGGALGRALAAATITIDPQEIVIAGEILGFGSLFIDAARRAFDAGVLPVDGSRGRLRASTMADEAGALGALTAAFRRSSLLVGYSSLSDLTRDPAHQPHAGATKAER